MHNLSLSFDANDEGLLDTIRGCLAVATSQSPVKVDTIMRAHYGSSIFDDYKRRQSADRKIRRKIEELRNSGAVIVSRNAKPYGYFFAENRQDCEDAAAALMGQAATMFRTARKMLSSEEFLRICGQLSIEFADHAKTEEQPS